MEKQQFGAQLTFPSPPSILLLKKPAFPIGKIIQMENSGWTLLVAVWERRINVRRGVGTCSVGSLE